jgi:type 2A phosphatase activator TIP41
VRWEATSGQINRALLTSRDPILYYDELALYESELDDHGSSRVSLKVGGPSMLCVL